MKKFLFAAVFLFAGILIGAAPTPKTKVIADFNSQSHNNLGGKFGELTPNPKEQVYVCVHMFDSAQKTEGNASLRLMYNVNKSGAFNGFWMKLGPSDASVLDAVPYRDLVFWLRGDAKLGIPTRFKIELKSGHQIAGYDVSNIGSEWKEVRIPLKEFADKGLPLNTLTELTILFEERSAAPATRGAINIDLIALE